MPKAYVVSGAVEHPGGGAGSSGRAGAAGLPPGGLGGLVTADAGDRPAVTLVDRARGERTELGCATLANWADKTANFVTEELDLAAGDELTVDIGSHWTTLVVLLGAWRAGVVARLGPSEAGTGPAVVGEDRLDGRAGDDVLVVGAGLVGRPLGDAHGGLAFPDDVLAMPDEFTPATLGADHPALRAEGAVLAHGELADAARAAAQLLGLRAGSRLASARPVDTVEGLVTGALAAWCADASLVLAADATTLDAVAASERADVVLDDGRGPQDAVPAVRCAVTPEGGVRVRR